MRIASVLLQEAFEKVSDMKSNGDLFNIFEILDRHWDEEKGHSAMIACLLDPKGTHGQKDFFLVQFLDLFGKKIHPQQPRELLQSKWTVHKEYSTPERKRIDIYLKSDDFVIAIENKIDTADSENQLFNYGQFLRALGRPSCLIYLVLNGEDPRNFSPGPSDADHRFFVMSYCEISQWLDRCMKNLGELKSITAVMKQYKTAIETIRNGGQDKMSQELAKLIKSSDHALAIRGLQKSLELRLRENQMLFWTELQKSIVSVENGHPLSCESDYQKYTSKKITDYQDMDKRNQGRYGLKFTILENDKWRIDTFITIQAGIFYYLLIHSKDEILRKLPIEGWDVKGKPFKKVNRGERSALDSEGYYSQVFWRGCDPPIIFDPRIKGFEKMVDDQDVLTSVSALVKEINHLRDQLEKITSGCLQED